MRIPLLLLVPAVLLLSACTTVNPRCCPQRCQQPTPPPAPAPAEDATHVLYDGRLGTPTRLDDFVAEALGTELVVFGELHGDLVGAEYQLALLKKLGGGARPVALAMEFFEADVQAAVDAYLAGEIDQETFKKQTKRNAAYDETHGPLVEWCKANGAPIIAANAPRTIVSGYRKSDLEYDEYRASLTEEEQAWLPDSTTVVEDDYWKKFAGLMGENRARPFFKSQSLWDDAMAESMAKFRDANPDHRILFIVGGFHVTDGLGTITKYLQRRPNDKVSAIVMSMSRDGSLTWDPDDHHAGNAVLRVKPPQKKASTGPNPHERPKKMPGTTTEEPTPKPAPPQS